MRFAEKVYGEFDEALDLKMKLGLPEALPPTYGSQEELVQSVIDLGGLTEERGRILFGESSPPFRGKVAPKWMAERAGTSPGWTPLAFEIFGGNLGRVTKLVRELNEVVRNIELTTRATDVNEFYSSRCSPYAQNLVLAGYVSPTDISAIWKGNHIRVEDNKELRVYKRVNGELIKVKTAAKDSVEYFKILSSPRS